MKKSVKGMIFILNPNPISLNFQESWLFNTVSKPGLSHLFAIYSPFVDLKVHGGRLYLVCLTLHVKVTGLHVREVIKGMIFILNPNPRSLSF